MVTPRGKLTWLFIFIDPLVVIGSKCLRRLLGLLLHRLAVHLVFRVYREALKLYVLLCRLFNCVASLLEACHLFFIKLALQETAPSYLSFRCPQCLVRDTVSPTVALIPTFLLI